MVLLKLGKSPQQKRSALGWRPISLLKIVRKVFKAILSSRITVAAQEYKLPPEEQIGNRANQLTTLAIQVLIEAVKSTWSQGGIASLL